MRHTLLRIITTFVAPLAGALGQSSSSTRRRDLLDANVFSAAMNAVVVPTAERRMAGPASDAKRIGEPRRDSRLN